MTATIAGSTAVTKILYPGGKLPDANYKQNVLGAMMNKATDFKGESRVVAVQTEWPQGLSADFATALGSLQQSTFSKFTVTRVEYFGIARVSGQALRAVEGDTGALVDLWKNEIDKTSKNVTRQLGIFGYGSGTGSLSAIDAASTVASATITVSPASAIVFYAVNMRVQAAQSDGGALRGGGATVTISGVDIDAGTLTTAGGNWSAQIAGLTAATDYLGRAGDMQNGGTAVAPTGVEGWVVGGASPGTLFGLSRNTNPVKLSGQSYNSTGIPYTDVAVEMAARVSAVGGEPGDTMFVHPRDLANWKKQLDGKVQYNRSETASKVTGLSFAALQIEGSNGTIKVLSDINCPRNKAYLLNMDNWKLHSIGPAPHILDYDSNQWLRVSNADAYEVRIGFYGNQWCDSPVNQIKATNFG